MLGGWSFTGNPEDVITIKNAAEEKLADYEKMKEEALRAAKEAKVFELLKG